MELVITEEYAVELTKTGRGIIVKLKMREATTMEHMRREAVGTAPWWF